MAQVRQLWHLPIFRMRITLLLIHWLIVHLLFVISDKVQKVSMQCNNIVLKYPQKFQKFITTQLFFSKNNNCLKHPMFMRARLGLSYVSSNFRQYLPLSLMCCIYWLCNNQKWLYVTTILHSMLKHYAVSKIEKKYLQAWWVSYGHFRGPLF